MIFINEVIISGRLTRDPETRYSQDGTCVAKYTLAVDRKFKRQGEQTADFINVTVFGKGGEFAEKYLSKGTKIMVSGRIQTGSYTNKDGVKVNTTDVIADEQEFCESKKSESVVEGEFQDIPEGIENELPFAQPQS